MESYKKQMEMVLYHSDEGDVSVDAYIMDESLWITQKSMAELFGVQKQFYMSLILFRRSQAVT
ncbi:hypothetical protein [Butyrivibrio sp. VCB2001]|jgi:hypothetical protein|uniref:hypothetical protein n=1 Tax=Butyrivibrio sp. VCB2001 TaxID=1280667 RepID=UPI00047DD499|nr:hypothetical protein [Butyrivibrio sp. VCB2001]